MSPYGDCVLSTLQLVTAPTGDVASRAERIGERVEFLRVGKLIDCVDFVLGTEAVVDADRELIQIEAAR